MSADSAGPGKREGRRPARGGLDRAQVDPLGIIPSVASRRWERRIGRLGLALLLGSVASLALVPSILGAVTGPIVHLRLPITYFQPGMCNVEVSFYLINGGNRAGSVVVGEFANGDPVANWTFKVPAYATVYEVEYFYVSACNLKTYATAILQVEPA